MQTTAQKIEGLKIETSKALAQAVREHGGYVRYFEGKGETFETGYYFRADGSMLVATTARGWDPAVTSVVSK